MPTGFCSGPVLRRALCGAFLASSVASGQTLQQNVAKKTAVHRANEFTLAGLQPGKDAASRAVQLYNKPQHTTSNHQSQMEWGATCQTQTLSIDLDAGKRIQVIRTIETPWPLGDCLKRTPGPWKTGLGLRVGDPASKTAHLYGEPDSKSPSTRDGQPLELWYYAFDWAGPDVPQVMEVLCSKGKDGQPKRVVEITLAAPSL
jgi:hypothetical protein